MTQKIWRILPYLTQLSFLLDLGAGHVQLKITNNPRPNCTPILGALGDLGGYIISDTMALTYRTLAPDWELYGWYHIDFIVL